jgi:glycosyltransferase 2 family protein
MYKILLLFLAIPLLWWSFRDISLPEIYETLQRINPQALLGLAMLNGFIFLLLSSRWWLVMRALGNGLPFLSLVGYRLAAFGITYFTPGPQFGGEPLQVHLVRSRHNLLGAVALAGVTLDKLLELLVNFSFLVFGLILVFRSHLPNSPGSGLALTFALGILVLPITYLLLLRMGYYPFTILLNRDTSSTGLQIALKRARQPVASAEEQMSGFLRHKPQAVCGALALSLLSWILIIAEYWLALQILGIHLEPVQVIFALTAVRIAFLLPFPAGLGALEAGQVAAMQMLGVEPALGISMSLLIRARDLSLGVIGLWLGGLLTRLGPLKLSVVAQPVNVNTERSDQR